MGLDNPPIQEKTTNQMGLFPQVWIAWFTKIRRILSGQEVIQLQSVTVATLPPVQTAGIIYVSDESGGAVLAFSDGVNWRRVTDRAIVS